jgi:hypothetical protein
MALPFLFLEDVMTAFALGLALSAAFIHAGR